jgi:hypothetical protein
MQSEESCRLPSVLIPYPGASTEKNVQDVFVYLRPETNGVNVESAILKAIQKSPAYKKDLFLVYLANIPGDFIVRNKVVEEHYAVRLYFAVHGGRAFTPFMKEEFERAFGCAYDPEKVIGAFEALRLYGFTPDRLFMLWVPNDCFRIINGQSIKKYDDRYIVNYDIPALLQKNSRATDIAAMIFRTYLSYDGFASIIRGMEESLIQSGLIREGTPLSYVFHYSKGPFEQVLDGIGYLYEKDSTHVALEKLSFCSYLKNRGVDFNAVLGLLKHPIIQVCGEKESAAGNFCGSRETYLYSFTMGDSFEASLAKLDRIVGQAAVPRHHH